jgi:hypothetical protein
MSESRVPGVQLGVGRLRVDAVKAIAKLREYQLPDRTDPAPDPWASPIADAELAALHGRLRAMSEHALAQLATPPSEVRDCERIAQTVAGAEVRGALWLDGDGVRVTTAQGAFELANRRIALSGVLLVAGARPPIAELDAIGGAAYGRLVRSLFRRRGVDPERARALLARALATSSLAWYDAPPDVTFAWQPAPLGPRALVDELGARASRGRASSTRPPPPPDPLAALAAALREQLAAVVRTAPSRTRSPRSARGRRSRSTPSPLTRRRFSTTSSRSSPTPPSAR